MAHPRSVRRGDAFFGRLGELAALGTALHDAEAGRGRLVLLTGEPGIGKTRIASRLEATAAERGCLVAWGRCHDGAGAPAYWPWLQIVRSLRKTHAAADAELAKLERRLAAAVSVPPARRAADPEQARFELFERVAATLCAVAGERSLLLVLDDLHWADASSVKLLQFLGPETAGARVVVVATLRELDPTTPPEVATLLGELATRASTIPLRGLDRAAVADLITDCAGGAPDPRLVERIFDATHGNPLFVGEVTRLLVAERRFDGPDAAAPSLPIPMGVRAAIARRIGALDADARAVLSAAAVCGREFARGAVAHAMRRSIASLQGPLESAERIGVISCSEEAGGRCAFAHALVRETLYEALSGGERSGWHRKIGTAIETLHAAHLEPHLSELAYHFRSTGDPADAARAVDYAHRSGESARRALAYEAAERDLGHALASLEHDPGATAWRRCAILVALAESQRGSGRVDAMVETFRRAIALARELDPHTFGDTVLRFSEARFEGSFFDESLVALLGEALARLPDEPAAVRARLLARLAAALHLQPGTEERRTALAEEATAMARALGDKQALAWVLMMRVLALLGPDNVHERLALTGEIIRLADENNQPIAALQAMTVRMHELLELGDVAAMDLAIEAFARRAGALKQPVYLWHLATWRGMRALLDGRLDQAETALGQALEAGQRALQETALMHYGQQLLALRFEQGRMREVEGLIRMAVEQAPTVASWRIELLSIELQNDRIPEAQAMLDELAVHGFRDLPRDANWLIATTSLAFSATELNDAARARQLYALLRPYAGRFVATRPAVLFLGSVSYFLGRLARTTGQLDVAAEHHAHALREHAQLGSRPWVARTQADLASLLAERGRRADEARALELADAACATARELGLVELLPRAVRAREQVRERTAGEGWRDVQEARLALVAGGRRMAAAAGRGGGRGVVELAPRRSGRPAIEETDRDDRAAPVPHTYALRREGGIWTIHFEGRTIRERHSLGLGYIAHLLASPDREVTAWDLAALDGVPMDDGPDPAIAQARGFDPGARVSGPLDQALEISDARAVGEYRSRLAELREETAEARARNDLGRLDRLDEEARFLESELARMAGFGGRSRQGGSSAERARLRVTKAIRYAIRKLAAHDAGLAEHLDVSVKTGMLCSYAPRPRLGGSWSVG